MSDEYDHLFDDWLNNSLSEEDALRLMATAKESSDLMRRFVEVNVRDQLLRRVVRTESIAVQVLTSPALSESGSPPGRQASANFTRRLLLTIATAASMVAVLWMVSARFAPVQNTPTTNTGTGPSKGPSIVQVEPPSRNPDRSSDPGITDRKTTEVINLILYEPSRGADGSFSCGTLDAIGFIDERTSLEDEILALAKIQ